jgi:hypothetical protein
MCDTLFCSSWSALNAYCILTLKIHDLDSNFKDTVGRQFMKFSFRPTQTWRQNCACDSSKFSVFHPLLAFDILTLYDLDRLFQGQRWKMVHSQSKRPPNRQIRIISSSSIKKNIRRQNLFKRNFRFQGQFSNFQFSKCHQFQCMIPHFVRLEML